METIIKYMLNFIARKARSGGSDTRTLIIHLLVGILFENLDILAELAHKTKTPLDDKMVELLRKIKNAGIV